MGEAIGQLLPYAVGVALSPMPIVALLLMRRRRAGRRLLRSRRSVGQAVDRHQGLDGPQQRHDHVVLCLIIGAKLIGDAITGLSA